LGKKATTWPGDRIRIRSRLGQREGNESFTEVHKDEPIKEGKTGPYRVIEKPFRELDWERRVPQLKIRQKFSRDLNYTKQIGIGKIVGGGGNEKKEVWDLG